MAGSLIERAPLGAFLAQNPFPNEWTDGLFYREKMRAIHFIAPKAIAHDDRILIGGGRSGMAAKLYPAADITTLDLDPAHQAHQPPPSEPALSAEMHERYLSKPTNLQSSRCSTCWNISSKISRRPAKHCA